MQRSAHVLIPVAVLALAVAGPAAGVIPDRPHLPPVPGPELPALAYPLPDAAALADQDKAAAAVGEPYRFAVPAETALTPRDAGRWSAAPDGRAVWRLRLASPGALSLNLGFVTCELPPSADLVVRPTAGGPALRYRGWMLEPGAPLWTPVLLTDDLTIELTVAAADRGRVALELARFNRGYRYFGEEPDGKAGDCNVDVVCPAGDGWREEIRSVGVYTLAGSFKCTGTMVNTTAHDATPYFLTAAHCGVTAANDQSVVVYWNYESPVCGAQTGGSLADSQAGSAWRATWSASDFTLLELVDAPDPAWDVTFAGWDRSGAVPDSTVCIHHPSTDEKSISFDRDPPTVTAYTFTDVPGDGTHWRVGAWELGTTEQGSSGSALFDPAHRIIGQLHGGYASCDDPGASDWYGRLSVSWTGGGTPNSRLSDWLDPEGTGAMTVDLFDPTAGFLTVVPLDPLAFEGPEGGPFAPAEQVYNLTNTGAASLDWTAVVGATWLTVAPTGGTLAPDGSVTVLAGASPLAAGLAAGSHRTILTFANTTGTGGDVVIPALIRVLDDQPRLERVGPNPMYGYVTVVYTLGSVRDVSGRVYDMRGRLVADLGTRTSEVGENSWSWDGTGDDGARAASGRYVLELDAGGRTLKVPLTGAHSPAAAGRRTEGPPGGPPSFPPRAATSGGSCARTPSLPAP